MRILQINTVYKNGGSTGRIVYDLSQVMRQEDIESYIAFGYEYSKTADQNTYKIEDIPALKCNILKTRVFGKHGFYNEGVTKKFLKWIDTVKPDIIHLHNLHNDYVNIELLFDYIKMHDIPVIWTLHDCWSFTGWCANFDFSGCDKWKTGCGHCPSLKEYPFTWFFDRSKEIYSGKKKIFNGVNNLTIITPSQWLADLVKQSFLKDYKVKVINNGIDLSVFKPLESNFREKHNLQNKTIVLAMAMKLSKQKGIEYLLQLPDLLPDDYCLVLVGINENQRKLLPKNNCVGITKTNNAVELAGIYSAADMFVNPTLGDNFPTTNLEALACGTPVITFRTGGSPESVDDNVGIVVAKGNLDELVNAIIKVREKGKLSYSSYCIAKASESYNKEKQALKYIDAYKENMKAKETVDL